MKTRALPLLLCALLACLLTGSASCTTAPGSIDESGADTQSGAGMSIGSEASPESISETFSAALSAAILAEINAARARAGLKPLTEQPALAEAARIRAREAAISWSHTRPDGSPWYTAGTGAGAAYGENLAKGFPYAAPRRNVDSAAARRHAAAVVATWLASPSHADNILSPDFHYACISTYLDAVGTIYEAMEFAY